jgi:molecular chaperone GrpE
VHEAVAQEPSSEVPEGSVVRQLRKGYKLKDRLVRAALVVVSGGPA